MLSTLGNRSRPTRNEKIVVAPLAKTPTRRKRIIPISPAASDDEDDENHAPKLPHKRARPTRKLQRPLAPFITLLQPTSVCFLVKLGPRNLHLRPRSSRPPNQSFVAPTLLSRLVGRQAERDVIVAFLEKHALRFKSGCLYISGQPGTGKTALLGEVLRDFETRSEDEMPKASSVKTIFLNCMSIKEPHGVFEKLVREIVGEKGIVEKDVIAQAERIVLGEDGRKKNVMYVVVLDEIDHLLTKDQDVLYKLFEWPTLPSACLTLIGIANALDLTDRFLPRLRAKNCEPLLLNFNPYTVSEINSIICDRLVSLDPPTHPNNPFEIVKQPSDIPLMQRQAVEFCARKVAAATGDLRKALDVCRQAIEIVEIESKKSVIAPLGESNTNAGDTPMQQSPRLVLDKAPKVTIAHVQRVLQGVFGSPAVQKVRALGFEHKVVLCCLAVMSRVTGGKKKGEITLRRFWGFYVEHCRRLRLCTPVKKEAFLTVIEMLDDAGVVNIGKAKEEMEKKLGLRVLHNEVVKGVEDVGVLAKLISIDA